MEFIHYDGDKLNTFTIDKYCSKIYINDNSPETVSDVSFFTENEGKFRTEESIVKYSKNTLYLYDLRNNLKGVFKFSRFVNTIDTQSQFSIKTTTTQNLQKVSEFYLKKDCNINLFKNMNAESEFYISSSINEDDLKKVESVVLLGNHYTVYKTLNDNLHISNNPSLRPHKFNGIIISKISQQKI